MCQKLGPRQESWALTELCALPKRSELDNPQSKDLSFPSNWELTRADMCLLLQRAGFRKKNFLFPNKLGIPEGRLSPPWLGALEGRLSHPLDAASCGQDWLCIPSHGGIFRESSFGPFLASWRSLESRLHPHQAWAPETGLGPLSGPICPLRQGPSSFLLCQPRPSPSSQGGSAPDGPVQCCWLS